MGRAYILYIYAHGRDGRAPQPICGEQDGRQGDGTGNGERGTGTEREEMEDGEIEKSRDVSQHTALSLSRPIRSWTSRIAAFSQMYFRLRDDTHRLDVCKTTKTIKNIKRFYFFVCLMVRAVEAVELPAVVPLHLVFAVFSIVNLIFFVFPCAHVCAFGEAAVGFAVL